MRRLPLLFLLLLAACHKEATAPAKQPQRATPSRAATTPQAPAPGQAEDSAARDDAKSAADMLRHYYGLIEAGKYDDAWRMRSGGRGIDAGQFAAHFKAYENYHNQVGTPSRPVELEGWLYVEVPVMTTGRFVGGKPFGSSGSVTLRRAAPGTVVPANEGGWRIYTG